MQHEWVFEVLRDLRDYARINGLEAVAAKAEEALVIAKAEVSLLSDPLATEPDMPPDSRTH